MKTSVIRQRVADFFRRHAPFDSLSDSDLLDLAGSGKVKFHQSEEYLFRQGDGKMPLVWVIQQGRVEVLDERDGSERLHDVLGEGDLLGLDRFAGDGSFQYSARTLSDVILYGVGAAEMEAVVARYPEVERYLSAHFSMAGGPGFERRTWLDSEPPPLSFLRARQGRQNYFSRELPKLVGAYTTRSAIRAMLEHNVDAVRIDDSTILSARELSLFCNHDVPGLIHKLQTALSPEEIAPLLPLARRFVMDALASANDLDECCLIGGHVIRAAADACIRLAEVEAVASGVSAPAVPHCWVLLGASARSDIPSPRFPAIAVIYDDSGPEFSPQESFYFVSVAGMTLHYMNESGLSGVGIEWPVGTQPAMPMQEWKRLYSETIGDPVRNHLFGRREFFDLVPLHGDGLICKQLSSRFCAEMAAQPMAISLLANDTLMSLPPLTLSEGMVVELDGVRHDSFDIETVLLQPIADAARVFALSSGQMEKAGTLERLTRAALDYPDAAGILREAADAFRIGLYHRTISGGRRIHPAKLGKLDQMLLKTAFTSVHRVVQFTVNRFV
jgi:signal-transduction protein with cAMP-binding, CBS, and nucleotidyltransferase domain